MRIQNCDVSAVLHPCDVFSRLFFDGLTQIMFHGNQPETEDEHTLVIVTASEDKDVRS